jgi:putative phosphoesterase
MRVVVLADTHVRDRGSTALTARALDELGRADVILHAGDVVEAGLLDLLRSIAPVHAVLGNNDVALRGVLPERAELTLDGVRVGMVHDSGLRAGREARMLRQFPDAGLVVFGHSHAPWNAAGLGGQWLFNPGSATQRRAQPHRTLGVLDLESGELRGHEVVIVD